MLLKFVISLLIWEFTLVICQSEGETCFAEQRNLPGICTTIRNCASVEKNLRKRIITHTRCSFRGRLEIVCCPIEDPPTTTTERTTPIRLHEQKCSEYSSAVFEYVNSNALSVGSEENRFRLDRCGRKHIPLIIGGQLAKPREFPHTALVGFEIGKDEIKWACGGTLISDRFVLTAGHCLYSRQLGEPKVVRLGELIIDSTEDDARPEDFNITELIPHPQWNFSSKYNDIALLKLDRTVKLSPYKIPACLPIQFEGPEKRNIAVGWGVTAWSGSSSTHLQKVTLDKFNVDECSTIYEQIIDRRFADGLRPATQICAGSRNDTKDTCQGDSGGPLLVFHHSEYCMYTIVGITSFGIHCGNAGVPGVYTRVFSYIDWIESTVWKS